MNESRKEIQGNIGARDRDQEVSRNYILETMVVSMSKKEDLEGGDGTSS